MREIISVGIGEYYVAKSPLVLRTILGSCVGVLLYDKAHKIGGLAHVYLPSSEDYKNTRDKSINSHKYADILIPHMINDMIKNGANKRYFISYILGGASLFNIKPDSNLNIGKKNLLMVKKILKETKITFFELKVGGNTGIKVFFDLTNGDINVKDLSKNGNNR